MCHCVAVRPARSGRASHAAELLSNCEGGGHCWGSAAPSLVMREPRKEASKSEPVPIASRCADPPGCYMGATPSAPRRSTAKGEPMSAFDAIAKDRVVVTRTGQPPPGSVQSGCRCVQDHDLRRQGRCHRSDLLSDTAHRTRGELHGPRSYVPAGLRRRNPAALRPQGAQGVPSRAPPTPSAEHHDPQRAWHPDRRLQHAGCSRHLASDRPGDRREQRLRSEKQEAKGRLKAFLNFRSCRLSLGAAAAQVLSASADAALDPAPSKMPRPWPHERARRHWVCALESRRGGWEVP